MIKIFEGIMPAQAAVEAINSLVDRLTVQSATAGSGLLDIKSAVRKDIASAARALPAPAMRQVANKVTLHS